MKVFLVRHADADAEIPDGLGDAGRALTARARVATAGHFESLRPRLDGVSLVLTSPLVRAVQTAQLLGSALGFEGLLRAHRALLPDMPVGALDALLRERAGETLVLVGHQPSMGAMAAHLLGLQALTRPVNPGTVIGLDLAEPVPDQPLTSTLLFFAAPGQGVLESL